MTEAGPRWATARTPSRDTLGGQAAKIAAQLGTPLLDWQRQVLDVVLELDPDTGQFAYRDWIVTVPRQQGKTTMLLVYILLRCLRSRSRIAYTAETGADARAKFERDWLPALKESPFARYVTAKMANGREALSFTNGSLATLIATTRKSGHGASIDAGILDEAFGHSDSRIEQALRPAMLTRPSAQFVITSTAGTPSESPYLWEKVQAGRQAVEAGLAHSLAYFEYSAADDADPADPETWASCMPALGRTIQAGAVAADQQIMDASEFARANLNRWVTSMVAPVISLETWNALADPRSEQVGPLVFGFDLSPGRTSAAISVAGKTGADKLHIETIDHREGTDWVVARLAELSERYSPWCLVCDGAGPAASLIPDLAAKGVNVVVTGARDMANACGILFDAAANDELRHLGTPELSAALTGAVKRPLGDAWAWSRKNSAVDISPLVAATVALWAFKTQEPERPPRARFINLAEVYRKMQAEEAAKGVQ